jgi:hypothetical protein
MLCKLFTAVYLAAAILFVHGLATMPQQDTKGSQDSPEKINADYRAMVLASTSFKEIIIGIGIMVVSIVIHVVYRHCYERDEPEVLPVYTKPVSSVQVRPLPQVQQTPSPQLKPILKVPDHTVLELRPVLGPHITHLPYINRQHK